MKKIGTAKGFFLAAIVFLSLAAALLLYFIDLPLLWTITLMVIVLATGIIGYVLGYLFGKRKS